MQLTITKRDLLRGIARTHGVADRKASMPILANVLLTAAEGALRFAATDLYLGVTATSPAQIETGGTIAVNAKTLHGIVKSLPDGDVRWTVGANHGVEIRVGKVRFRVPGMPGEDMPPLPKVDDMGLACAHSDALADLISHTSYAMSNDDTRPHLAGTLFESDGTTLRMVTTDGHRLSKHERTGDCGVFSMLVPSRGVGELKRLAEDADGIVQIAKVGAVGFFSHGDVTLSVKLADEQFPPYAKVIPEKHTHRAIVSRSLLVDALRRIALVSARVSGSVRLTLASGSLGISSENAEVGDGSEDVNVDYVGEGVTIGFCAAYLLDVLGALDDDEIALELGGELDPGVIRPASGGGFVGVVMPVRL